MSLKYPSEDRRVGGEEGCMSVEVYNEGLSKGHQTIT